MEKEGVIKYKQNWLKSIDFPEYDISELIEYRNKCFNQKWIGFDNDFKVGYGNISLRYKQQQFFISGSQTGHIPVLNREHFSFISDVGIEQNKIDCIGLVKASSESLTHAAIYKVSDKIKAVIHIHNKLLWEKYLHKLATSSSSIEYGTPEMAKEIARLFKNNKKGKGLLLMAGHEDGIIAWGESFEEAFNLLEAL